MTTLEPDTQKELTDAEEVANLIQSTGWGVIKGKLDERILDLQNINNLDLTAIDTVAAQIAARKMASDLIFAWLKQDVFGFVEQQSVNSQNLIDKQEEGFINRV